MMAAEGGICLDGQEARMSADFSVKPVGVSAPATVVRPAPEAVREAVRTQLAAAQSVTAAETAKALPRDGAQIDRERLSRQTVFDQDSAQLVYQVVDRRTDHVVAQVPDEAKRRARAYFREMERNKEANRPLLTDRSV
jgi:uncharacterized FlaG/YvyC family protein